MLRKSVSYKETDAYTIDFLYTKPRFLTLCSQKQFLYEKTMHTKAIFNLRTRCFKHRFHHLKSMFLTWISIVFMQSCKREQY